MYRDPTSFHLSSPKSLFFNFINYDHARLFTVENPMLFDFIEGDGIRLPEQEQAEARHVGYDPYKADVYVLGILYKKNLTSVGVIPYTHPIHSSSSHFAQVYGEIEKILKPLIDGMTQSNPNDRFSAEDALKCLSDIRAFHDNLKKDKSLSAVSKRVLQRLAHWKEPRSIKGQSLEVQNGQSGSR